MNKQIEKLLKYQEVDKELKFIEDDLRKSEESQKFLTAKKFLGTVNDSLSNLENKAKVIVDSYNITIKEIEKYKKLASEYAKNVETCENENELNYLKKKFQSTLDSLNTLETKINNISKDMDELLNTLKNIFLSYSYQCVLRHTDFSQKMSYLL